MSIRWVGEFEPGAANAQQLVTAPRHTSALSVLEEILAEFDRSIEAMKADAGSWRGLPWARRIVSDRADKLRGHADYPWPSRPTSADDPCGKEWLAKHCPSCRKNLEPENMQKWQEIINGKPVVFCCRECADKFCLEGAAAAKQELSKRWQAGKQITEDEVRSACGVPASLDSPCCPAPKGIKITLGDGSEKYVRLVPGSAPFNADVSDSLDTLDKAATCGDVAGVKVEPCKHFRLSSGAALCGSSGPFHPGSEYLTSNYADVTCKECQRLVL